jgi:hypothetical protein
MSAIPISMASLPKFSKECNQNFLSITAGKRERERKKETIKSKTI